MLYNNVPALLIIAASLIGFWALTPNFISWLLLAEVFWIGLFILFSVTSSQLDSLIIAIWGLFIVCLATCESATGLSLMIYNFMKSGNIHGTSS